MTVLKNPKLDLHAFFEAQLLDFQLAADNYRKLENVRTKSFDYGSFKLYVHFNPARALSTLAKLDQQSILERPCFLCHKNRPAIQQSLNYQGLFDICINPYPICYKHFTIISKQHEPQLLNDQKIASFYQLAADLEGWIILYNGARSGASAPDHFHFQAVGPEFFPYPIETPMPGLINKISFSSDSIQNAAQELKKQMAQLANGSGEEPQLNLFCEYKAGCWVSTLFPRRCHRPRQFFATDHTQIMSSPGAIDMTGHLIVAREEDFLKIDRETLEDIYRQVSL